MTIEEELRALADKYAKALKDKIDARVEEMESDDHSHYLVYQVLGVTDEEGRLIDIYQNKGRFLYKYAGSFLEEATKVCFLRTFPDSGSLKIPNTEGVRPKTFEIDCLEGSNAIEIKWRDATTDGDHITKEHTRINEREIKGTGSYLQTTSSLLKISSTQQTQAFQEVHHAKNSQVYTRQPAYYLPHSFQDSPAGLPHQGQGQ